MIYADNAATTKMSKNAIDTMVSVMNETFGNPSSLYEVGQRAKEVLERSSIDGMARCMPSASTAGASRKPNWRTTTGSTASAS